jgi:hypothetical protein
MPSNPSIYGSSVWGGAQQITVPLLNTSNKELYVASAQWKLPIVPALTPVSEETTSASGTGVAGVSVSPGTWIATDSEGNSKLIYVKDPPERTIVWMSSYLPLYDGSELKDIQIQDVDMISASIGGLGSPILWRGTANNEGLCELLCLPSGHNLLVKYMESEESNLWFISYDADSAHTINVSLSRMPTEIALASGPSDISVSVNGEVVSVVSLDASTGEILLNAVPDALPVCTYWILAGDTFA